MLPLRAAVGLGCFLATCFLPYVALAQHKSPLPNGRVSGGIARLPGSGPVLAADSAPGQPAAGKPPRRLPTHLPAGPPAPVPDQAGLVDGPFAGRAVNPSPHSRGQVTEAWQPGQLPPPPAVDPRRTTFDHLPADGASGLVREVAADQLPRSPATDPRSPAIDPRSPATDPRSPATDPRSPAIDPRRTTYGRVPADGSSGLVREVAADDMLRPPVIDPRRTTFERLPSSPGAGTIRPVDEPGLMRLPVIDPRGTTYEDTASVATSGLVRTAEEYDRRPSSNQLFQQQQIARRYPNRRGLSLEDARMVALQLNRDITVFQMRNQQEATKIDEQLAPFDTIVGGNVVGGRNHSQNRNVLDAFGALINEQTTDTILPYDDDNQMYVERKLLTGATYRAGLVSDYQRVSPDQAQFFVNPGWRSALRLHWETPLFKGRGRAVNEAPILIARANTRESFFLFRARINDTLRLVEAAYWELYSAQMKLEVYNALATRAQRTLDRIKEKLELGGTTRQEVYRAETRLAQARADYQLAVSTFDVAHANLLIQLGIPPGEETLEITSVPYHETELPSIEATTCRTLMRPEIQAAQAAVDAAQRDVMLQANGTRADVTVFADYAVTGLERDFGDSWRTLGRYEFSEWQVGMVCKNPLGRRDAYAKTSRAQFVLAQRLAALEKAQILVRNELQAAFDQVQSAERIIVFQHDRLKAATEDRDAISTLYENGRSSLDILLRAEDRLLSAQLELLGAITRLQKALALWKHASGTIADDYQIEGETQEQVIPVLDPVPGTNNGPADPQPPVGPSPAVTAASGQAVIVN